MICPSSVSRFMLAPLPSPSIKIHQKHVVAREARRLKNQPTVGDSYYIQDYPIIIFVVEFSSLPNIAFHQLQIPLSCCIAQENSLLKIKRNYLTK